MLHLLRAASYIEKLHAPDSKRRSEIVDLARKRFASLTPRRTTSPKKCGRRKTQATILHLPARCAGFGCGCTAVGRADRLDFANGSCVALFTTGPYQATTRAMHPSVMLLVQQPKENETLEDYAKKFQTHGYLEPFTPQCPAQTCIALKGVQPGVYKGDGDGRPRLVFFERDEPEFPGLIFESPLELPKPDGTGGAKAYHPLQIQQRILGKLYYLVTLDTASSIEEPSLKDFEFFLENLTVE